jgi:hydroxymethylpyrimidine pyrophosphatase-like HAD family hydrolase
MADEKKKIAILYDVDHTLLKEDHPNLLLRKRGLNPVQFWEEVDNLQKDHKNKFPDSNVDGFYINYIAKLSSIKGSPFYGLTIKELEEIGKEHMSTLFAPGLPEFFQKIKDFHPEAEIQHNLVSLGIDHMLRSSELGKNVSRIFAFTFAEHLDGSLIVAGTNSSLEKDSAAKKVSRGRYYKSGKEGEEFPMQNMICIGDGNSDREMFRQMATSGGTAICVYDSNKPGDFERAKKLKERIKNIILIPADFTEGSELWKVVNAAIDTSI